MSEPGDSPETPVTCHLPVGERTFLSSLRCPAGKPYRFERRGSVGGTCPDPASHEGPHPDPTEAGSIPVDHYELTCGCGEHQRTVYMDMYHPSPSGAGTSGGSDRRSAQDSDLAAVPEAEAKEEGSEERRLEELKTLLNRHIRPGETFVVEREQEGEVTVRPGSRSTLAKTHPRFYGYLLASSQRISDAAGCGLFVFYMALGAGLCFAIRAGAFHGFAEGNLRTLELLEQLQTWWIYLPILCTAFWLHWKHDHLSEGRRYQVERKELAEHLVRERLDPYEVLAKLEGDEEVSTICKWMKGDGKLSSLSR